MLRALGLMWVAFFTTLLARLSGKPRHTNWSFSFEMVIRYLRLDWEDTADWEFARLRADMDRRPYPSDFAKKVTHQDSELAELPVRRFIPPGGAPDDRVVLFFHGGSYVFGSAKTTHCELISRLAFESGRAVVGPDFRLLPEHHYPAQLEDARRVFEALVRAGTAPEHIVVAGDSSGGNLALALALDRRDRGEPPPAALVLISPWVDLSMPGASFVKHDRYDFGTREVLEKQARAFAGSLELTDPRISPSYADLSGLCPCLVVVGEVELPRDDIVSLYDKLKTAGVDAHLHLARSMPHSPPAMAALHPEGAVSMARIASYVNNHLS